MRGAGPEDLLGLGALFALAPVEDESIPVRQINRHRSSQPSSNCSLVTEAATDSPSPLSLFEAKSKALSKVLLKFFSDGEPMEEPMPESTGEEARC